MYSRIDTNFEDIQQSVIELKPSRFVGASLYLTVGIILVVSLRNYPPQPRGGICSAYPEVERRFMGLVKRRKPPATSAAAAKHYPPRQNAIFTIILLFRSIVPN